MKKAIFVIFILTIFFTSTISAQIVEKTANTNSLTDQEAKTGKTAETVEINLADCPLKGTPDCPVINSCPLKGTPDCPLVKNCPKKGTTQCPYKAVISADNLSTTAQKYAKYLPDCCKKVRAGCCSEL